MRFHAQEAHILFLCFPLKNVHTYALTRNAVNGGFPFQAINHQAERKLFLCFFMKNIRTFAPTIDGFVAQLVEQLTLNQRV